MKMARWYGVRVRNKYGELVWWNDQSEAVGGQCWSGPRDSDGCVVFPCNMILGLTRAEWVARTYGGIVAMFDVVASPVHADAAEFLN